MSLLLWKMLSILLPTISAWVEPSFSLSFLLSSIVVDEAKRLEGKPLSSDVAAGEFEIGEFVPTDF